MGEGGRGNLLSTYYAPSPAWCSLHFTARQALLPSAWPPSGLISTLGLSFSASKT